MSNPAVIPSVEPGATANDQETSANDKAQQQEQQPPQADKELQQPQQQQQQPQEKEPTQEDGSGTDETRQPQASTLPEYTDDIKEEQTATAATPAGVDMKRKLIQQILNLDKANAELVEENALLEDHVTRSAAKIEEMHVSYDELSKIAETSGSCCWLQHSVDKTISHYAIRAQLHGAALQPLLFEKDGTHFFSTVLRR